ncbi:MFS transporter [Streptosporangium sp. NPDC000396]|uniref:MFS transporter n=1 Tax=Streptosporangium sp. NPDC000396 TaxID=3366185 RepID=UPI0036A93D56
MEIRHGNPATVGPPTTAPTITAELHGGEDLIKRLGSACTLAMGVLLVVGGRLGDKYGRRRLFLIGMSGFTIASAVAGLSPNPAVLILARGLGLVLAVRLLPHDDGDASTGVDGVGSAAVTSVFFQSARSGFAPP